MLECLLNFFDEEELNCERGVLLERVERILDFLEWFFYFIICLISFWYRFFWCFIRILLLMFYRCVEVLVFIYKVV